MPLANGRPQSAKITDPRSIYHVQVETTLHTQIDKVEKASGSYRL